MTYDQMQKELARLATALIFLSDANRDDIERRLPDIVEQLNAANAEIQRERPEVKPGEMRLA